MSETEADNDTPQVALIKNQIKQALTDVTSAGTFACFSPGSGFTNPGLSVNGLGPVGLPLSDRDAAAIKGVCHQSAFGKGPETVVDTSVRRTWELDANQFMIRNPEWEGLLQNTVKSVVRSLDCACGPDNVVAIPYKLLLYEEGAFFSPTRTRKRQSACLGHW